MVIRVTAHDNDFSGIIAKFMRTIPMCMVRYYDSDCQTPEDYKKARENIVYFGDVMNPNNDIKITDSIKKKIIAKIKEEFIRFIKGYGLDAKTTNYLINNFEISIVNTVTDKWENGEVFYWMQHSGTVLNQ